MIKKSIFALSILCGLLIGLAACSPKGSHSATEEVEPAIEYTSADSIEILSLSTEYARLFASHQLDSTAAMLYTYHDNEVTPLSDDKRQDYTDAMKDIPVLSCQLEDIDLRSYTNNKVRFAVLVGNQGLGGNSSLIFMNLNPVKVGDSWYLTIFDKYAEGVDRYDE